VRGYRRSVPALGDRAPSTEPDPVEPGASPLRAPPLRAPPPASAAPVGAAPSDRNAETSPMRRHRCQWRAMYPQTTPGAGSSTCSIAVARIGSAARITTPFSHGSSLEVSNRIGIWVAIAVTA